MRVQCAHEQRVAKDREAAIVRAAADDLAGCEPVPVDPEDAPGLRIERDDIIRALREVHDAVDHER